MSKKVKNIGEEYIGPLLARAHIVTPTIDKSFPLGSSDRPALFDIKPYSRLPKELKEYNIVVFEKLDKVLPNNKLYYKPVKIVYMGFDVLSLDEMPEFLNRVGCEGRFIQSRINKMKAAGAEFCVQLPRYPYTEALTGICEVVDQEHNAIWPSVAALAS